MAKSRMKFIDDDQEAIRRLNSGIDNLRRATENLLLTADEESFIKSLIARQAERRSFFQDRLNQRIAETKKAVAKLERLEQERIDEAHKKSGFTDFIVRVPGSFGSNGK